MPFDLTSVHAKVDRAYVHLRAIEEELVSHNQAHPYGLRQELEDEGRTHVGYFDIFREPGGVFGVLIGDALHNLRCALDHLVHAAVRARVTDVVYDGIKGRLAFPICDSPSLWSKALKGGRLDEVPDPIVAFFDRCQPFQTHQTPSDSPLAILRDLNDIDKHRLLHTVAAHVGASAIDSADFSADALLLNLSMGPYEDGAEVYRYTTIEPTPQVDMRMELATEIRLQERPATRDAIELIRWIGQSIQRIAWRTGQLG